MTINMYMIEQALRFMQGLWLHDLASAGAILGGFIILKLHSGNQLQIVNSWSD